MLKTLTFAISIRSPRRIVWDTMLDPEGYRAWTTAFCEGSHFTGSWEEGQTIRFLAPNGNGMTSIVAENRKYDHVSVRHVGEIVAGIEDTTSPGVLAWAPAYENFSMVDSDEGTRLEVTLDTLPEQEEFMMEAYPNALLQLKVLCEQKALGHQS